MLSPKQLLSAEQKRLLELFGRLSDSDRGLALAFLELLAGRRSAVDRVGPPPEPEPIPRPANESVVAAIRRLSATYAMLDKSLILHEASSLMGAHIMQGRPAAEVIDELEVLFRRHYDRLAEDPQAATDKDAK